ncbi:MAG: hypothetical protein AAF125_16605, partial [Chloroflexota bacterium]
MSESQNRTVWIGIVVITGVLLVFSSLLTLVILQNKGFNTDGWVNISFPMWYEIPRAFTESSINQRRPVAGVYYALMLKAFDYDNNLTYFAAHTLLISAHTLMALALYVSFPKRPIMILSGVLVSFFWPDLLQLSAQLSADNLRLANVFYWIGVLLYQYDMREHRPLNFSLLPPLFFLAALLCYESVAALPVLTAALLLPLYLRRYQPFRLGHFLGTFVQLVVSHLLAFAAFTYVRGVYNISSHWDRTDANPARMIFDSTILFLRDLHSRVLLPIHWNDPLALLMGIWLIVGLGGVFYWLHRRNVTDGKLDVTDAYIALVALAAWVAGMLPFAVYNFPASPGSRLYTTAIYGMALLVGLGVSLLWRRPWLRPVGIGLVVLWAGIGGANHVNLRHYMEAEHLTQTELFENWYRLAPALADDTTILFVDYGVGSVLAESDAD